jgi:hypothetical protein
MSTPDNKTTKRKLALQRESLATLDGGDLDRAVGGAAEQTGFCPTWPFPRPTKPTQI